MSTCEYENIIVETRYLAKLVGSYTQFVSSNSEGRKLPINYKGTFLLALEKTFKLLYKQSLLITPYDSPIQLPECQHLKLSQVFNTGSQVALHQNKSRNDDSHDVPWDHRPP